MWQVAEAKNKFSEFLTKADHEGPQRVTRRGRTYVLLTEVEYDRLAGKPTISLGEYLLRGPSFEGVDLRRDRVPPREVTLDFSDD